MLSWRWSSTIYPFTPILVPLKLIWWTYCFICKLILGVCLGTVFLCLFPLGYKLHQSLKRRRCKIRKEKFFKQNGGYLLQQKFHANTTTVLAMIFTAEELQEAADNFNESRFFGQGGYGTVYKGMLLDGSTVAVKSEIAGCCLETEVPLLVYEFGSNGTLSHHLHAKDQLKPALSWDTRLRIACEVAGACTFGYIDPEYFQSNRRDDGRNLIMHFVSLAKENQVHQILDSRLAGEAEPKDIDAIARLATRCLRSNGKKRPTMRKDSIVSTYELGFTSTLESARCGRVFM
ncbi:unnamed protein product [Prunus brigantina]